MHSSANSTIDGNLIIESLSDTEEGINATETNANDLSQNTVANSQKDALSSGMRLYLEDGSELMPGTELLYGVNRELYVYESHLKVIHQIEMQRNQFLQDNCTSEERRRQASEDKINVVGQARLINVETGCDRRRDDDLNEAIKQRQIFEIDNFSENESELKIHYGSVKETIYFFIKNDKPCLLRTFHRLSDDRSGKRLVYEDNSSELVPIGTKLIYTGNKFKDESNRLIVKISRIKSQNKYERKRIKRKGAELTTTTSNSSNTAAQSQKKTRMQSNEWIEYKQLCLEDGTLISANTKVVYKNGRLSLEDGSKLIYLIQHKRQQFVQEQYESSKISESSKIRKCPKEKINAQDINRLVNLEGLNRLEDKELDEAITNDEIYEVDNYELLRSGANLFYGKIQETVIFYVKDEKAHLVQKYKHFCSQRYEQRLVEDQDLAREIKDNTILIYKENELIIQETQKQVVKKGTVVGIKKRMKSSVVQANTKCTQGNTSSQNLSETAEEEIRDENEDENDNAPNYLAHNKKPKVNKEPSEYDKLCLVDGTPLASGTTVIYQDGQFSLEDDTEVIQLIEYQRQVFLQNNYNSPARTCDKTKLEATGIHRLIEVDRKSHANSVMDLDNAIKKGEIYEIDNFKIEDSKIKLLYGKVKETLLFYVKDGTPRLVQSANQAVMKKNGQRLIAEDNFKNPIVSNTKLIYQDCKLFLPDSHKQALRKSTVQNIIKRNSKRIADKEKEVANNATKNNNPGITENLQLYLQDGTLLPENTVLIYNQNLRLEDGREVINHIDKERQDFLQKNYDSSIRRISARNVTQARGKKRLIDIETRQDKDHNDTLKQAIEKDQIYEIDNFKLVNSKKVLVYGKKAETLLFYIKNDRPYVVMSIHNYRCKRGDQRLVFDRSPNEDLMHGTKIIYKDKQLFVAETDERLVKKYAITKKARSEAKRKTIAQYHAASDLSENDEEEILDENDEAPTAEPMDNNLETSHDQNILEDIDHFSQYNQVCHLDGTPLQANTIINYKEGKLSLTDGTEVIYLIEYLRKKFYSENASPQVKCNIENFKASTRLKRLIDLETGLDRKDDVDLNAAIEKNEIYELPNFKITDGQVQLYYGRVKETIWFYMKNGEPRLVVPAGTLANRKYSNRLVYKNNPSKTIKRHETLIYTGNGFVIQSTGEQVVKTSAIKEKLRTQKKRKLEESQLAVDENENQVEENVNDQKDMIDCSDEAAAEVAQDVNDRMEIDVSLPLAEPESCEANMQVEQPTIRAPVMQNVVPIGHVPCYFIHNQVQLQQLERDENSKNNSRSTNPATMTYDGSKNPVFHERKNIYIAPVAAISQLGVFTSEDMPFQKKPLGFYFGKEISAEEFPRVCQDKRYVFCCFKQGGGVEPDSYIDALELRDVFAYFNHSPTPNCRVTCDTFGRPQCYLLRAIKAGEQLTFDYGSDYFIGSGIQPMYLHATDNWQSDSEKYLARKNCYLEKEYQFDVQTCKDLQLKYADTLLPAVFSAILENNEKKLVDLLKTTDPEILAYSLKNRLIANYSDQQHLTPLMLACYLGRAKCILALFDAGADAGRCMLNAGDSPLILLLKGKANPETIQEIAPKLLEKMSHPLVANAQGFTTLHYAIRCNNLDLVKAILKCKDQTGQLFDRVLQETNHTEKHAAFDYCVQHAQFEILECLLKWACKSQYVEEFYKNIRKGAIFSRENLKDVPKEHILKLMDLINTKFRTEKKIAKKIVKYLQEFINDSDEMETSEDDKQKPVQSAKTVSGNLFFAEQNTFFVMNKSSPGLSRKNPKGTTMFGVFNRTNEPSSQTNIRVSHAQFTKTTKK